MTEQSELMLSVKLKAFFVRGQKNTFIHINVQGVRVLTKLRRIFIVNKSEN